MICYASVCIYTVKTIKNILYNIPIYPIKYISMQYNSICILYVIPALGL